MLTSAMPFHPEHPAREAASRTHASHGRLAKLARGDKWYLGGLDGVVWAPPFPAWLQWPGFWDPVHLLNLEVGPGFSVALLDREGGEVSLERGPGDGAGAGEAAAWEWLPGRLNAVWKAASPGAAGAKGSAAGFAAVETRRVLSGGLLESSWSLADGAAPNQVAEIARTGGSLVAFTAQPVGSASPTCGLYDRRIQLETLSQVDQAGRAHLAAVGMELSGPDPARRFGGR